MEILLFAVIFFIFYLWIFSSTGAVLASIFRLRTLTNYTNLLVGCFAYFCVMAIAIIPLEFVYTLNYVILIYYLLAINVIYILIVMVFIRVWFNLKLLKWDHLWYLVALALFIGLYFVKTNLFAVSGSYDNWYRAFIGTELVSKTDIILSNRPIGTDVNAGTNLWFAMIGMWLIIFQGTPLSNLVNDVIFLIDPMIFAAFFVTIVTHFINQKYSKLTTGTLVLIVMLASKIAIYYFGYDAWTNQNMFDNLILAVLILATIYFNAPYRMRHMPWMLSIVIASYIAFDWSSSYLLLFMIYVLAWTALFRYEQNFTKDLIKIAFLPFFEFLVYEIAFGSYFLIFVFVVLIGLMMGVSAIFRRRYKRIQLVEQVVYNHRQILVFVIPIIFLIIAIILFLAGTHFDFSYWDFKTISPSIYSQVESLLTYAQMQIIFVTISFVLLGLGIVWLIFQGLLPHFSAKPVITILAILLVTFFNPFVGKFLVAIFKGPALANNGIMIMVCIIFLVIIGVASIKIEKIKNVRALQVMIDWTRGFVAQNTEYRRKKNRMKRYNMLKVKNNKGVSHHEHRASKKSHR